MFLKYLDKTEHFFHKDCTIVQSHRTTDIMIAVWIDELNHSQHRSASQNKLQTIMFTRNLTLSDYLPIDIDSKPLKIIP